MGDDIPTLQAAIEKASKKNVSVKSAQKVSAPQRLSVPIPLYRAVSATVAHFLLAASLNQAFEAADASGSHAKGAGGSQGWSLSPPRRSNARVPPCRVCLPHCSRIPFVGRNRPTISWPC